MTSKMLRTEALAGFMLSIVFGTVLVLILGEAYRPGFIETWPTTKMLWAVMTTGCLGISAYAATIALDSVRDLVRT